MTSACRNYLFKRINEVLKRMKGQGGVKAGRRKNTSKKVAIVGGIPEPVGGVTTFICRLIAANSVVERVYDLYPGKKRIPKEFKGEVVHGPRLWTLVRLYFSCATFGRKVIHFNFSTPKALALLKLLPKRRNATWLLTLHHGNLHRYDNQSVGQCLRKVDLAFSLNKRQFDWYSRYLPITKIISSTSYVPARWVDACDVVKEQVRDLREKYKTIYVTSGFPRAIYNHLLAISFVSSERSAALICCLYGTGEQKSEILNKAKKLDNVLVFESLPEPDFNFVLSSADYYLRLTAEDSFGIAVADAINFGVTVLATDVCTRYRGAFLMKVPSSSRDIADVIKKIKTKPEDVPQSTFDPGVFCYPDSILERI